jgi:hypothetical protein
MSKWVKLISATACALLLSASVSMAADDSDLTVSELKFRNSITKDIVWFDSYDLGGSVGTNTYVYNDATGTNSANTDGLVEARNYTEQKSVQISVPTLGSTSIDARVESRAGTDTAWGEIVTVNFASATTIDHIVNVVEYCEEIRVGVRSNGTAGTDSVTITGILRGENK